ncbi:hypothetical protein VHEMI06955 [[Torrubiella] hemipterigena]|uniref:Uncharacterized protein n=1 Tax=[Torrubiella] hemipterigena TaxID=1531966 RepID=A0A0A1T244_9HYPO|nr:hypothetical protein VHEMI06955 [[Torrubiella] hemipterigena]
MKIAVATLLLATLVSSTIAAPVNDQARDVAEIGASLEDVQALFHGQENDDTDFDQLEKRAVLDKLRKAPGGAINAITIADEIFEGIKKVFDDFKKKHTKSKNPPKIADKPVQAKPGQTAGGQPAQPPVADASPAPQA